MILVDTSIWIDHFRDRDASIEFLLKRQRALIHPYVVGELALGSLKNRELVLGSLRTLPQAPIAQPDDVLFLIQQNGLMNSGIGYVDAHLLTSVKLAPDTRIWTRDRRLVKAAIALDINYVPG